MEVKIGKGLTLDVETARFTREVMDHVVYIGLRNILMDSHANVSKATVAQQVNGHLMSLEEWEAEIKKQSLDASSKKLQAMYDGEVRAMSERTRLAPIEREARIMALTAIQDQLRANGKKLNVYTSDQYAALVTKNFPKYMDKAAEIVALRDTKPEVELDLEGLDL